MILFLIDSMTSGGKERRLTELMKRLCGYPDIKFELAVMSKEIHYQEVFDLKIPIHYILRKRKKDLSVFSKFYKLCKETKPDIVHCWDGMTAIYISPICKILKIKLVNGMIVDTPIHFNFLNQSWIRSKLTFPFSDMIIGNSEAGLKAYKAPKKKAVCIYNGIDISRFENLKDPKILLKEIFGEESAGDFIIGMVAAFEDRKDYKTLVEAALILIESEPNIRFVLVGTGKNFNEIDKSIPIHLKNKILLLGKRSDVESIVNIFDIGVLLTNSKVHGEGISNSILEYMALSKPVIATKGGGTNELVSDQINGYLIDTESINQLVDRITFLKSKAQLRNEIGKNGKSLIIGNFNANLMTRNYVSQYIKLINK